MGRRRIVRKLEAMHKDVTAWQRRHRQQMAALEQQMTGIERSVAQAEDDAHLASLTMGDIRVNVLRRLEQLEQLMEIRTLVSQGRIPEDTV